MTLEGLVWPKGSSVNFIKSVMSIYGTIPKHLPGDILVSR
jgi:hypothetical protein